MPGDRVRRGPVPLAGVLRARAALAAEGEPSMDAVLAVAARHGIEMLGPVPAATTS